MNDNYCFNNVMTVNGHACSAYDKSPGFITIRIVE
jgi:hypothetical protein